MHGMYDELLSNLAILVLSGFVGFAVISKVPNTLHTPLMSGTNAIHGIVVLGGILLLVNGLADGFLNKLLLVIAVTFGTINVVGEEGQLELNFEDEIVSGACVARDGEVVHPGVKKALEATA